jgi:hypothetical protein
VKSWLVKAQGWIERKLWCIRHSKELMSSLDQVKLDLVTIDHQRSLMQYERDIARIDLANMNRWKERALAAERKVERNRAILKQRGPRPLRLP